MNTIERLIRKQLPGAKLAKIRAEVRQICASPVAIEQLRALSTNPHSMVPPTACDALADELERMARERARNLARNEEIKHAIEHGCPICGAKLRRNNSLEGWWQCGQFGAPGFRDDSTKPACTWQAFTVKVD